MSSEGVDRFDSKQPCVTRSNAPSSVGKWGRGQATKCSAFPEQVGVPSNMHCATFARLATALPGPQQAAQ